MTTLLSEYSQLFTLAAEMYMAHAPDHRGWCAVCQMYSCPVRGHAAQVIEAAGISPAVFDTSFPSATTEPTVKLPQVQHRSHFAASRTRPRVGRESPYRGQLVGQ